MAQVKNYSVLKPIRAWLDKVVFTFKGEEISQADAHLMRTALSYQYALGCDLLPSSQMRHYERWLSSTGVIDVYNFGKFLGNLDVHIKNYLYDYERNSGPLWRDVPSFKRSASDCKGFWGFMAPVYEALTSFLLQPEIPEFSLLIQWVNFIRRLNLRDLDLTTIMEEEYVSFEAEMHEWTYDSAFLDAINAIIREWFPPRRDMSDFRPRHGPGSVAGFKGRLPVYMKYHLAAVDDRLMYLRKYVGDIDSLFAVPTVFALERCSEIVCVPKSMITNRTISKEPCSLQYFQQGVMAMMMEDVLNHPYLSRRISFIDQSKSSEMAMAGSIFGDFATIDLSAASDSVTLHIVKRAFRGTWLLPMLICTRSDKTCLPSGDVVSLAKFAPMGSAVCFPVETILFAACCEYAVRTSGQKRQNYRVFGDDIIISEGSVEQLFATLTKCHFKVNSTKSFWGSQLLNFREACGGEYFNGYEVTPLRIARKFRARQHLTMSDADHISSYMSFANEAFDRGYLQLRREILHDLRSNVPLWMFDQFLYSSSGERGLKTFPDGCTNYKLRSRINTDLQLLEVNGIVPKSIKLDDGCQGCKLYDHIAPVNRALCEHLRYFEWLRRTESFSEEQKVIDAALTICPSRPAMGRAWSATTLL